MKKKAILILAVAVMSALGAIAETVTATYTVEPKMTCAGCENRIKSNLRFEKGIVAIAPSAKKQTVVIKYNNEKTTSEAIVAAFKKIGYKASEVSAKK